MEYFVREKCDLGSICWSKTFYLSPKQLKLSHVTTGKGKLDLSIGQNYFHRLELADRSYLNFHWPDHQPTEVTKLKGLNP
jgi:hypothetical protein